MKSIISTCQGETFRAEAQSPWSGTILLVTHGGWYLETERWDILLLHDVRFGEIPIGAALPDIGELPYDKRFEHIEYWLYVDELSNSRFLSPTSL